MFSRTEFHPLHSPLLTWNELLCKLKPKLSYDRRSVGQSVLVSDHYLPLPRNRDRSYFLFHGNDLQTFAFIFVRSTLSGEGMGL
jgi:hypothetical protein